MPVITNVKLNLYLKEVADLCDIMTRRTFATTLTLSNGVPNETASKLFGTFENSNNQVYARVLQDKLSLDMSELSRKFKNGKD